MSHRKYTKEQFIEAVAKSTSIAQVLKLFNMKPAGGNYQTVKKYIQELSLDISHFKGQGCNKGKYFGPKRNIEDYLSNQYSIQSYKLGKRLLKEGFFVAKCSNCNNDTWLDKPIPLELEHKDGNHFNNNLSNLCLLCPNCHALTDTYRGKNKSKKLSSAVPLQKVSPNLTPFI